MILHGFFSVDKISYIRTLDNIEEVMVWLKVNKYGIGKDLDEMGSEVPSDG